MTHSRHDLGLPRLWFSAVTVFLAAAVQVNTAWANNVDASDFEGQSSWSQPSVDDVRTQIDDWLGELNLDDDVVTRVNDAWNSTDKELLLDRLALTLAAADPRYEEMVTRCLNPRTDFTTSQFDWLRSPRGRSEKEADEAESELSFEVSNLRLFFGRWLANNQLYNESLDQLEDLQPEDVVDPATLLFYQSVAHHRLLNKERAMLTLARLLENEKQLPRRYLTLARLMEADLKPLKPDTLNEISRLMDNIRVRLDHGRAGKRVRKEEDDVITKLDKMIEELEKQAQQSGGGSGQAGGNAPTAPMQDSSPGGTKGPGNVDPKRIGTQADWGNLPPRQREEALQRLGKDLPSHYRVVIEEYFRKLASESDDSPASSR